MEGFLRQQTSVVPQTGAGICHEDVNMEEGAGLEIMTPESVFPDSTGFSGKSLTY